MVIRKSFRIAVKALKTNKLRTGLAMLGMTIGVAAVLTMFALGTGAQQSVSKDVKSAGTTLINVRAGNFTRGGEESKIATGLGSATTLIADDAEAIRSQVQGGRRAIADGCHPLHQAAEDARHQLSIEHYDLGGRGR
ncbi:ABC transporter permease [Terriglobus sp. YAF25]|uniref:ABC transporter permease n=1 Tax=Terriglobus sp. YAF25 TaxID=3233080 RepID=UPI003F9EA478